MDASCLVLLSGGQDSATCLMWAIRNFNGIHAVTVDYGQKHKVEIQSARQLASLAVVASHIEIDFPTLKQIGDSDLLTDVEIGDQIHRSGELPASFVPCRNYLLLGLAAAVAFKKGISHLVTGVCETDYSGYPDCRNDSIRAVETALSLCLGDE